MTKRNLNNALALQHKEARYDAIDAVKNTMSILEVLHEEGKLSFNLIAKEMQRLEIKIMNLPQRKVTIKD